MVERQTNKLAMTHMSSSSGNPVGLAEPASTSSARIERDLAMERQQYPKIDLHRVHYLPQPKDDETLPATLVTEDGSLDFDTIDTLRVQPRGKVFSRVVPRFIATRSRVTNKSVTHAAKSVCLIQVWRKKNLQNKASLYCSGTGVHVGKGYILTALHVVQAKQDVAVLANFTIRAIWRSDGDYRHIGIDCRDGVTVQPISCPIAAISTSCGLFCLDGSVPEGYDIAILRAEDLSRVPSKVANVGTIHSPEGHVKLVAINQDIGEVTEQRLKRSNPVTNTESHMRRYITRMLPQFLSVAEGSASRSTSNSHLWFGRFHSLQGSSGGMILNDSNQYIGIHFAFTAKDSLKTLPEDRAKFLLFASPLVSSFLKRELLPRFDACKPEDSEIRRRWELVLQQTEQRLVSPLQDAEDL